MKHQGRYFEKIFSGDYLVKLLDLGDGTLRTEDGRSFQIHKFTLARSCKYFYSLFCGMGKEKHDYMIPGVKGEDLSNILSFLYTGNIHVTEENILDLIVASDYLLLDDLLLRLKQHLRKNLNPSNSLSILKTSLEINQRDISRETYRYIQTHFEDICWDSQLLKLPLDTLKQLLSDRNLRVTSETVVWWSVINWVEADTVGRLCSVPELLLHLPILDVDDNMADSILQHEIVAKNPYCEEIFDVKWHTSNGGLKTLQYYFQAWTRPVMPLFYHRQPRHLYLICRSNTRHVKKPTDIYVTYDENVDLWRKITEVNSKPQFVLCFNSCIYLIDDSYLFRNLFYNVIDKQWNDLPAFRKPRHFYQVVELGGRIYVLGGLDDQDETELHDGEYYDFETGDWHTTEPMIPVDNFRAVTLRNSIYVLGCLCNGGDLQMVFQAYDPSSDTWNMLPSPTTSRAAAEMVVYRDMIYVIGGFKHGTPLKIVEVFDVSTNGWITEADLPFAYNPIKAVILNDKLIIYEQDYYESVPPPVQWNFYQKRWEVFDFSMKSVYKYNFIKVENECLGIFSRENKDPGTHFEYSPFA